MDRWIQLSIGGSLNDETNNQRVSTLNAYA